MKCGIRMAVALGAGYLLGRSKTARRGARKLVLGRGVRKLVPGDLTGELGSRVGELVETMRGELLDAAKAAATTALTSRIDSLSSSLHGRAEALRNPSAAGGAGAEDAEPEDEDTEPEKTSAPSRTVRARRGPRPAAAH